MTVLHRVGLSRLHELVALSLIEFVAASSSSKKLVTARRSAFATLALGVRGRQTCFSAGVCLACENGP